MTQTATTYLDRFLDQKSTHSAVLLEGPWGSGKTFFVKKYLKDRAERLAIQPGSNGGGFLYVSLNGVKANREVHDQFFAQVYPNLDHPTARLVGSLAVGLVGSLTKFKPGEKDFDALRSLMVNPKDQVLVFDDLERCAMPLSEILGFINNFVEQDGRKVIVLASEAGITGKRREDYDLGKEKLIGKTIRVGSDAGTVYDLLVNGLPSGKAQDSARENRSSGLAVFNESTLGNFRSLRSVLDDYDSLVSQVSPKLAESPQAMRQLFLSMLAFGMEVRAGSLTAEDVHTYLLNPTYRGPETDPQETRVKDVIGKYSSVAWSDTLVTLDLLMQVFSSGQVNVVEINAQLDMHPVLNRATAPAWRKLWDWTQQTQSEYQASREEFIDDLTTRKYRDPAIILHAIGLVLDLAKAGDQLVGDDIEVYFERYLDDLAASGEMIVDREFAEFPHSAYGLGFHSRAQPLFRTLMEAVFERMEASAEFKAQAGVEDLIQRLIAGDGASATYEDWAGGGIFDRTAFLQHVPASTFAALLLHDGRLDINRWVALHRRYDLGEMRLMTSEAAWLGQLRREVDQLVALTSPPHQAHAKSEVDRHFGKLRISFARRELDLDSLMVNLRTT